MGISWHAAKFSRRTHGEIMSQVRSHVLFGPHGLTSTHGVEKFDNWPRPSDHADMMMTMTDASEAARDMPGCKHMRRTCARVPC